MTAVERIAEELPVLLPGEEAAHAELLALVARLRLPSADPERNEEVLDEILALVTARQPTRRRLVELLDYPPMIELADPPRNSNSFPRMAGDAITGYERHACPECGWTWVVLDADEDDRPPDRCPNDGAALTYAPEA